RGANVSPSRTSSVPPALPVVSSRPETAGTGQLSPAFRVRFSRVTPAWSFTSSHESALACTTSRGCGCAAPGSAAAAAAAGEPAGGSASDVPTGSGLTGAAAAETGEITGAAATGTGVCTGGAVSGAVAGGAADDAKAWATGGGAAGRTAWSASGAKRSGTVITTSAGSRPSPDRRYHPA